MSKLLKKNSRPGIYGKLLVVADYLAKQNIDISGSAGEIAAVTAWKLFEGGQDAKDVPCMPSCIYGKTKSLHVPL